MKAELLVEAYSALGTAIIKGRPLIAFSGGKDSLVVGHLAKDMGIKDAVCEESFTFSIMRDDTRENASKLGLKCQFMDSIGLEWLSQHPKMMFATLKKQSALYAARQQSTILVASAAFGSVITGRRAQTNTVRSSGYYKDSVWQCHPLRSWKDEDVYEYLTVHHIKLPRIYATEFGKREGFAPWLCAEPVHFPDPWRTVYDIEPEIVHAAAEWIPGAKDWLF